MVGSQVHSGRQGLDVRYPGRSYPNTQAARTCSRRQERYERDAFGIVMEWWNIFGNVLTHHHFCAADTDVTRA